MRIQRRRVALRWASAALVTLGLGSSTCAQAQTEDAHARVEARGADIDAAEGLTEEAVFARWLEDGRELDALRAEIGAARFRVVQARVLPNPVVGLSSSLLVRGVPPDGTVNFGPEVSWEIPAFGQVRARRNAATQELRFVEMQTAALIWERAQDIRAAMIERAFAYAVAQRLEVSRDELVQLLQRLETRSRLGAEQPYDVVRLQVEVGSFEAAIQRAYATLVELEGHLLALVAVPGLSRAPVARDGLAAYSSDDDVASLTARALERRPDLHALRLGIRARELEAQQYRVEARPSPVLSLGGWVTRNANSSSVTMSVGVPLPLFDRNQGRIGEALARADGLRAAVEALEARVQLEVETALRRRALAAAALARFQEQSLAAATALLARAQVAYQEGAFSVVDLLDAQRAVWAAREQELALELEVARSNALVVHVTSGAVGAR